MKVVVLERIERYFRRGIFSQRELALVLPIIIFIVIHILFTGSRLGNAADWVLTSVSIFPLYALLRQRGVKLDQADTELNQKAQLSKNPLAIAIANRSKIKHWVTTSTLLLYPWMGCALGMLGISKSVSAVGGLLAAIVTTAGELATAGVLGSLIYVLINCRRLRTRYGIKKCLSSRLE